MVIALPKVKELVEKLPEEIDDLFEMKLYYGPCLPCFTSKLYCQKGC